MVMPPAEQGTSCQPHPAAGAPRAAYLSAHTAATQASVRAGCGAPCGTAVPLLSGCPLAQCVYCGRLAEVLLASRGSRGWKAGHWAACGAAGAGGVQGTLSK
jgi:hypothetical protein